MTRSLLIGAVFLLFLVFLPLSFAQETVPLMPQPTATQVEYALPYPGILPYHPLFMFKRLRDQILLFLISNPVKKSEFYILLADKQLNMSQLLLNENKSDLAVDTVAKSTDYLKSAQDVIFTVQSGDNPTVTNTKRRLELSMLKHLEVLGEMEENLPEPYKQKLALQIQAIQTLLTDFRNKK